MGIHRFLAAFLIDLEGEAPHLKRRDLRCVEYPVQYLEAIEAMMFVKKVMLLPKRDEKHRAIGPDPLNREAIDPHRFEIRSQ